MIYILVHIGGQYHDAVHAGMERHHGRGSAPHHEPKQGMALARQEQLKTSAAGAVHLHSSGGGVVYTSAADEVGACLNIYRCRFFYNKSLL